jgi:hypothetical protein
MTDLRFASRGARADRYAAAPTLLIDLRVTEATGAAVAALALRCQLRIEPARRRYTREEGELLADLFGPPARWGQTQKPMQFAAVSVLVPAFTGSTDLALPVPCSYDLEVAAGKYFAALDDGEIPLLLLFSGQAFQVTGQGLRVDPVPWDREVSLRLPVAVWREVMDLHFPDSGWLRLRVGTLAALQRFKSRRALATWDDTVEALLADAGAQR